MPVRLHVIHILKESFKSVWNHKLEWVRVASAPFLIWIIGFLFMGGVDMVTGHYAGLHLNPERHLIIAWQTDTHLGAFAHIIYALCAFFSTIILYINGYRYAVLGENGHKWFGLNVHHRVGKFTLYLFCVSVISTLFMGVATLSYLEVFRVSHSQMITLLCGAAFGLLGLYLVLRIGFYYLLISLDIHRPIRTSWGLLKGNVIRIGIITFLVMASFTFLFSLGLSAALLLELALESIGLVPPLFAPLWESGFLLKLGSMLGGLVWALSWAVLTKAYAIAFKEIAESDV